MASRYLCTEAPPPDEGWNHPSHGQLVANASINLGQAAQRPGRQVRDCRLPRLLLSRLCLVGSQPLLERAGLTAGEGGRER